MKLGAIKYAAAILAGGLFSVTLHAQADTLHLNESVLVSRRNESMLAPSAGSLRVNMDQLKSMPAVLGSTDPLRMARFLPSMSASTEIDAGIHIQGNEHSHNLVSSGGVPIYGAHHLLGLFSTFNPAHFSDMDYATSVPEANRLGGKMDILLPEEPGKGTSGEVSLGLLALASSVRFPTDRQGNGSVTASLRRSYINLLYGPFLHMNSSALKYGFTDVNVTGIWRPSRKDRLWADFYYGNDEAIQSSDDESTELDIFWHNAMAALHHRRDFSGGAYLRQKAYVSRYALSPMVSFASVQFQFPSDLSTVGYDLQFCHPRWQGGASFIHHTATPQQLEFKGHSFKSAGNPSVQHGQEGTLFARYRRDIGHLELDGMLKGILWHGPDGTWSPKAAGELSLGYTMGRSGRLQLRGNVCHQHLIQTGFTGLGLPFEFWMLPGQYCDPQRSVGASMQYRVSFLQDAYILTSECYYKTLSNQVEYRGGIIDLISQPYSLADVLHSGHGRTFGLNLMLHRTSGPLTGWLSFSLGRSLRTFSPEEGEIPSCHERLFEVDLVAAYDVGKWKFSLATQVAGGSPYTPAKDMYLLAQYIMIDYGAPNSARLPVYRRTDIGVNYTLSKSSSLKRVINFSIYNVFMADNPIYRNLHHSPSGYRYGFDSLGISFMPSLSYTLHFK